MSENTPAWLVHLERDDALPTEPAGESSTHPTSIVILTDRAGVVAATLRFEGNGHEYTGARGGDMHLRALLVELFHHRKKAAVHANDRPFSRSWLRSHFHSHLHLIEPDLIAHPPLVGDHPQMEHVVIGRPLPSALAHRFSLPFAHLGGDGVGLAPA